MLMQKWMKSGGALLIALAIAGCASNGNDVKATTETVPEETTTAMTTAPVETPAATPAPIVIDPNNPLLAKWVGPYGGVPPFDQIKVEQFKPALETAMAENLAEVDRIANDPAPPTFENT
jgi:peptidyl-dipeptidase Dcp